jgi:hypothetical protein
MIPQKYLLTALPLLCMFAGCAADDMYQGPSCDEGQCDDLVQDPATIFIDARDPIEVEVGREYSVSPLVEEEGSFDELHVNITTDDLLMTNFEPVTVRVNQAGTYEDRPYAFGIEYDPGLRRLISPDFFNTRWSWAEVTITQDDDRYHLRGTMVRTKDSDREYETEERPVDMDIEVEDGEAFHFYVFPTWSRDQFEGEDYETTIEFLPAK